MKQTTLWRALGAVTASLLVAVAVAAPGGAAPSDRIGLAPHVVGTAVTVNKSASCTSADGHKATIWVSGSASKPTIHYKMTSSSGKHLVLITDWGTLPKKSANFSATHDGVKRSAGTLPYSRGLGDINFQATFGKNWLGGTKYCNINFNF